MFEILIAAAFGAFQAPECQVTFDRWQVAGVSVEKVLVKPAAQLALPADAPVPPDGKLPFDAILFVTLKRP